MRNANIKIRVTKEGERLRILDRTLYNSIVSTMKPGRPYAMRLTAWKEHTISDPLRRYYFGVVLQEIENYTGHSSLALHDFFKRKFMGVHIDKHGIEIVPSVFSDSSSISVIEKSQFVSAVRTWAAEFLGVYIPEPQTVVE